MAQNNPIKPYSFLTIEVDAAGQLKEKGSKFLAFAFPVCTEEDIKEKLTGLKKKYFDATHHCYAWVLGPEKNRYRAADDGEPNHSAGDPILGQIRSKNLTDVLVVVVRYFGGTKLGVSGLIAAYRAAAADALNQATIVERELKQTATLEFTYDHTPEVMRLVKDFELEIIEQHFDDQGRMEVLVKLRLLEAFKTKCELLLALSRLSKISYEATLNT